MNILYLDIETLPAPPEVEPAILEQYNKIPERSFSFEDYWRRTSLSANYGQILCISYAKNDEPTQNLIGAEREILENFWPLALGVDRFVGHNALDFDLPFIVKRSIIQRIKPSRSISFARYRSEPIFDTMREWDNWSSSPSTSLDRLAKIFGYETSKQGIDGSQVYDFWKAGRTQEIYDYCARDVELTRKIYKRLTFQDTEELNNG
ncbi:MAG: ribonuclease H-like domain-containing protein [Patescibacteria group bacterium]